MKSVLTFLCIVGLTLADDTFQLDPAASEIQFSLHDPLYTVQDSLKLKRGEIRWDRATGRQPEKSSSTSPAA